MPKMSMGTEQRIEQRRIGAVATLKMLLDRVDGLDISGRDKQIVAFVIKEEIAKIGKP